MCQRPWFLLEACSVEAKLMVNAITANVIASKLKGSFQLPKKSR